VEHRAEAAKKHDSPHPSRPAQPGGVPRWARPAERVDQRAQPDAVSASEATMNSGNTKPAEPTKPQSRR